LHGTYDFNNKDLLTCVLCTPICQVGWCGHSTVVPQHPTALDNLRSSAGHRPRSPSRSRCPARHGQTLRKMCLTRTTAMMRSLVTIEIECPSATSRRYETLYVLLHAGVANYNSLRKLLVQYGHDNNYLVFTYQPNTDPFLDRLVNVSGY